MKCLLMMETIRSQLSLVALGVRDEKTVEEPHELTKVHSQSDFNTLCKVPCYVLCGAACIVRTVLSLFISCHNGWILREREWEKRW